MEDAFVGRRDGGLVFWCHDVTGERSDRGAGQSASARFPRPTCEAAPRRRVRPRTVDALQLRLRPRDGVEGRRDGAASMEAHRSARYRGAAQGLAAHTAALPPTFRVKRLQRRSVATKPLARHHCGPLVAFSHAFGCEMASPFFCGGRTGAASRTRTAARAVLDCLQNARERRLPRRPLENPLALHSRRWGKTGRQRSHARRPRGSPPSEPREARPTALDNGGSPADVKHA